MLQAIASGLLGRAAFQGGTATAALGVGLHFLIALTAAAVYFATSRAVPLLTRRAVPAGLAYGIAVYLFMNHVVLPLSRVTPRTTSWNIIAALVIIHMLAVGLPIALSVRRGSPR